MSKTIKRRQLLKRPVEFTDLPELLQRIYTGRGLVSKNDLSRELTALLPYKGLKNIELAAQRLVQALDKQQRVIIVGDFDADGATSSALAVSALRAFGLDDVDFIVPNRFHFGYGLSPEIVDVANEREPDLIVTVDNGISSVAGVQRARDYGIDVIITDHHLAGDSVPEDCIIVNPNQPGDNFESKNMAGVGVIFYVMLALRAALSECGWFAESDITCPNMAQYLDLVALGTVADVVPLDKNNRIMVFHGIARMKAGKARPGILALIDIAGRKYEQVRAADLGYVIGPRLNAAGRLDDMSLGINCLLEPNYQSALAFGKELDELNVQRRALAEEMETEAFAAVDALDLEKNTPFGVCLYEPHWHQGIVGLVAARVKERLHTPVIAFAKESKGMLKGSARSVSGLHIRDALDHLAKKNPHLISKFGGHAMAAGLAIAEKDFKEFAKAFNEVVSDLVDQQRLAAELLTDGPLSSEYFTLETAQMLRQAGPWGQNFPEPLFDGNFSIIEQRLVGRNHLKMLLMSDDCDYCIDAIAFNIDKNIWPNENCAAINAAYRLDINEFKGRTKLQLLIEEMQAI